MNVQINPTRWPELPLESWKDTYATLHMWTQIVGKIRLALSPRINHWWEVPLYVNSVGLTTSPIPYEGHIFEIQFDFVHHKLSIRTSRDKERAMALAPRSVADFYEEFMECLASLGIHVKIWKMPVEIPNPIAFDQDTQHASYDPEYANRLWRILVVVDETFKEFRSGFIGKNSPVHFFWGSFDLAVTRFSGRRAPAREGADAVTREAYSHEVISAGFCLRGPGTDRFRASTSRPGKRFLSSPDARIPSHVRRRSQCFRPKSRASGISAEHLRGRCAFGELEPRGTGEARGSLNRICFFHRLNLRLAFRINRNLKKEFFRWVPRAMSTETFAWEAQ
jgi:hypothetical protein